MQQKTVSKILMICSLLMVSSPAWADDDAKCTNRSLNGDYGFSVEGVVLALPGVTVPLGNSRSAVLP